MRLAGRVAAAIEILYEVLDRYRPASESLKDWGKAHRFAGSTDRHAVGTLVYDALRSKNSSAQRGGGDTARAIILGALVNQWRMSVGEIAALAEEKHGPGALSARELAVLTADNKVSALHVSGDFPEWLTPTFSDLFGANAASEGAALAKRAPIDLRVNTLKTDREKLLAALQGFGAVAGPWVPTSIRIAAPGHGEKHLSIEAEPSHGMGWFEVQDSASQIAAQLSGVQPGETVADICAGAGGKTLALASFMQNKGRIFAHDQDRRRLRPIFERMLRSGADCIEVLSADNGSGLDAVGGIDCVVVDTPCTGSGAWRRKPDSKWKLTPKLLEQRTADQRDVLKRGAALVKPGGRLVYITCSILPQENTDQVKAFLSANRNYNVIPYTAQWSRHIGGNMPRSADGNAETLLLTPHQHDVDGFFVAVLRRGA